MTNLARLLTVLALCVCSSFSAFSALSAEAKATDFTRIVLFRHAPKASVQDGADRKDPPLNKRGLIIAEAFSDLADIYGISAIYSTNFKRTKDTVKPLAAKASLVIDTSISPFDYTSQLEDIITNHSHKTVVIVGHSNTVPGFINYILPEENMLDLAEDAYSDLFIIKYYSQSEVELIKLTHDVKTTHNLLIKD